MLVLALESSTSAAKAMLYDTQAGCVALEQEPYGPAVSRGGQADTELVLEATLRAGRRAAAGRDVAAVAVCGTWHSLGVCNARMEPVTPTFTWEFTGTAELCARMRQDRDLWDYFYRRTGCPPHCTYPRHALQYLRETGLTLGDKRFITQGAYTFYRLTGEVRESVSTQCGTGVINIHRLCYDREILAYLGVREDQFGALATLEDTAPLSPAGAALLGVASGIPVVPAHPDGALNQIGNYANLPGRMTLSVGTSAAMRVVSERPVFPENRELWCYYGVNSWISGAATAGACNCINWFCDTQLENRYTFAEMDRRAEEVREVPVFLPFLYGERCPGWHDGAEAAFFGLRPGHTAGNLYRAVEMGVLFNLKQCYEILCRENGVPERLVVSGGIVNSPQWSQMLADIFERELLVVKNPHASCAGAAALALHAAGALADVNAFQSETREARAVLPGAAPRAYYEREYGRYLECYARMTEEEEKNGKKLC